MGNAMLDRLEARYDAKVQAAETLISQWMLDTLQITLHNRYGWGYERLKRLDEDWRETRKKYRAALNPDKNGKNDADYWQEKMDAVMADICKGRQSVIPFEERYEELKKVRYRK